MAEPQHPPARAAARSAGWSDVAAAAAARVAGIAVDALPQAVVDALVDDFGAALARIWLWDGATELLHLEASSGLTTAAPAQDTDAGRIDLTTYPYMLGELARSGKPFVRNDPAGVAEFEQAALASEGVAAVAALPLLVAGELQGVLVHFARCVLPPAQVHVLAAFATTVSGLIGHARARRCEADARRAAETSAERWTFLTQAGRALSASVDDEKAMTTIARLAVPAIADWCAVDAVAGDGSLRRLAVVHAETSKEALARALGVRYPSIAHAPYGPEHVARTGRAELVDPVTDAVLGAIAADEEHHGVLRQLGFRSYMAAPIIVRDRVAGVVTCITAESGRRYGADDLETLEGLATSAGLAVENAVLVHDLQRSSRTCEEAYALLDALFASAPVGLAVLDTDLRYVRINQALADLNGLPVEAHLGATATELFDGSGARADALRRRVLDTGQPVIDVEPSGETRAEPGTARHWQVVYYPIRDGDDEVSGVGAIVNETTEQRRTQEALDRERSFLAAVLHNLGDGVVACDERARFTVFNPAAQELHRTVAGSVPQERWAERFNLFQADGTTPLRPEEVPLSRALAGETVRNVEVVVAPRDGDPRAVVCNGQPIVDTAGRAQGAVVTLHDVTQRKRAETELIRQALHDPLTGLANRVLLLDRMRHAMARTQRRPGSVAVLFLDLDRFKVVNDSLGHDVGDELLVAVAGRLRSMVRPGDTVARLGGDEFVVLCEDVAGERAAVEVARRIEAAVRAPGVLTAHDTDLVLTTSVGIALATGDERPQDLLRNADTAMYRAKRGGRARHELFDATLRTDAVERLDAENALRHAIAHGGLRLLYQPIVDVATGRLVGTEALVRYERPGGGLVPAADFIYVAEDSGLIVPLGAWVLAEACRQTRRWRETGASQDLHVSVNLSARQLGDSTLVDLLERTLASEGLPAAAVSLEITESVLMDAAASTVRILDRLKEAGPLLGIDDFGTGYSSLTYLRRFPVDFLKIDRSFVAGLGTDPGDTAIVTAVVGLGKALGLTTIAEGVETAGQLAALADLGCDRAQGYHFGRPQAPAAIAQLLAGTR